MLKFSFENRITLESSAYSISLNKLSKGKNCWSKFKVFNGNARLLGGIILKLMSPVDAQNHCLIHNLSMFAPFVAFLLTSHLLKTTSSPPNLTFSSSLKHRFQQQLIVTPSLFPHTFSILSSVPKADVAPMSEMTSLALVFSAASRRITWWCCSTSNFWPIYRFFICLLTLVFHMSIQVQEGTPAWHLLSQIVCRYRARQWVCNWEQ